jgi:hypothetical protein
MREFSCPSHFVLSVIQIVRAFPSRSFGAVSIGSAADDVEKSRYEDLSLKAIGGKNEISLNKQLSFSSACFSLASDECLRIDTCTAADGVNHSNSSVLYFQMMRQLLLRE